MKGPKIRLKPFKEYRYMWNREMRRWLRNGITRNFGKIEMALDFVTEQEGIERLIDYEEASVAVEVMFFDQPPEYKKTIWLYIDSPTRVAVETFNERGEQVLIGEVNIRRTARQSVNGETG